MSLEFVRTSQPPPANLAAEANHRIANHISMISGLLRVQGADLGRKQEAMTGPEVRAVLEECGARLEAVAKIHRLLAEGQDGASINIAAYLSDIAEGIVSGLSIGGVIKLRCDIAPCALPPEKAVLLGLIVGELVTNAVKYAHPAGVAGMINLETSRRENGALVIEVSDDGVGLPENFDPSDGGGLGFRMIRELAARLEARVSFDNFGLGLTCVVRMPCGGAALKVVS